MSETSISRVDRAIHWLKSCVGRPLRFTAGLLLAGALAAPAIGQGPAPAPRAPTGAAASMPVASPGATTAAILGKADVDAWLDGFLPYALKRGDVAGAVVVIVKDGQVLTKRGFGYADVAARKPVDPDATMFRPGSVSKLFTWTAAMQMVEQGKLDLDADVNRYLDFKIPPYQGKPVTLRNLMTHTPGFEEAVRRLIVLDDKPAPALGALLKQWVPDRIFPAGKVPAYTNYGAALAGYLVERVSGEPFDTYVERHIYAPLGMTRSSFRQPLPPQLRGLAARGYLTASAPAQPYEIVAMAPAGSLSATGADMARFMMAHLADGGPLLRPATARMMHTTTYEMLPRISKMALGFYTQDQNGHRVIAHGGDTKLFHSALWLFTDDNVGVFISMNSAGRDGVTAAIRGELLKQFANRYFPGPTSVGKVDAATAKRDAALMTGWYRVSRRSDSSFLRAGAILGQVHVTATKDGNLRIDPQNTIGGGKREWQEIAPLLWQASDSGDLMEARLVDGRIERFASSPVSTYQPIPWSLSAGWLFPALKFAFAIVLLTGLAWPAAAISRRLYAAPLALSGRRRGVYHAVRGLSLLAVLVVLGWAYVYLGAISQVLAGDADWLVILLGIATPIVFVGLLLFAAWNAWMAWTQPRGWAGRVWSLLLVVAAMLAVWGGIGLGLFGFSLNF